MEEGMRMQHYSPHFTGIFPVLAFDIDDVDIPSKTRSISRFDIFLLVSSIFMHIIDMAFDINVAIRYLIARKITYFAITTTFIFFPSLINVIISRRMQDQDRKADSRRNTSNEFRLAYVITKAKLYFIMAVVFQLAPILHYYETLKHALKARKCEKLGDRNGQRQHYLKMIKEDQDGALLRVFECFLEAAPQQILQMTILLKHYHNSINLEFIHQVGSISSSLVSMGWAMASYHRCIRFAQHDKSNIGVTGSILQFLWHLSITVSRILSLSIVASLWPLYTIIVCICHWIGMSIWILIDAHGILEFCRDYDRIPHMSPTIKERFYSMLFASVIGVVHIFIYLNAVAGKTFLKHIFFYVLCFIENVAASLVWIFTSPTEVKQAWYFNVLIVLCIVPFLMGIIAMVIYYAVFHPASKQKSSHISADANQIMCTNDT